MGFQGQYTDPITGLYNMRARQHDPATGRFLPSSITNSNGETMPVPSSAKGPTPVESTKGFQFTGGSGGNGLDPRATGVRIMDPVTSGKFMYPNGYVSYMNALKQTVNPWTGNTIPPADPWTHWEWGR